MIEEDDEAFWRRMWDVPTVQEPADTARRRRSPSPAPEDEDGQAASSTSG